MRAAQNDGHRGGTSAPAQSAYAHKGCCISNAQHAAGCLRGPANCHPSMPLHTQGAHNFPRAGWRCHRSLKHATRTELPARQRRIVRSHRAHVTLAHAWPHRAIGAALCVLVLKGLPAPERACSMVPAAPRPAIKCIGLTARRRRGLVHVDNRGGFATPLPDVDV